MTSKKMLKSGFQTKKPYSISQDLFEMLPMFLKAKKHAAIGSGICISFLKTSDDVDEIIFDGAKFAGEVMRDGQQIATNESIRAQADNAFGVKGKGQGVAVLNVWGIIDYRFGEFAEWFGICDVVRLQEVFDLLIEDSRISTIILCVDSPGGSSYGVTEFAESVFHAREKKRIVALADPMAASAAYHIATSAHELYCIPSGLVGSVGVYMLHVDYSEHLKDEGIKATFIQAGEYKTEGNPYEPLSDEAKKHFQEIVDMHYEDFVSSLARNRGVSKETVIERFGKGRALDAKTALQNQMIDGILSLKELLLQELSALQDAESKRAAFANAKVLLEIERMKNA